MLADLIATGDADNLDIWHEWEQASKGRQQLTWSKGIRALAGLAEQQRTDEEIAEDDLDDDDLLILDRDTWKVVAPVQQDLLEAAAHGGFAGAVAWLERGGLDYAVTGADRVAQFGAAGLAQERTTVADLPPEDDPGLPDAE